MDASYYETRRKEIQSEINKWKREMRDLENEYISSNQKIPIGSKVCITTPACTEQWSGNSTPEKKRYAYVVGYEIRFGEIEPQLMKAKKDGTISKLQDRVSSLKSETIKLV